MYRSSATMQVLWNTAAAVWTALHWLSVAIGAFWLAFLSIAVLAFLRIGYSTTTPMLMLRVPEVVAHAPWFVRKPVVCFLRGVDTATADAAQFLLAMGRDKAFGGGLSSLARLMPAGTGNDAGNGSGDGSARGPVTVPATIKAPPPAIREPNRPPVKRRDVPAASILSALAAPAPAQPAQPVPVVEASAAATDKKQA